LIIEFSEARGLRKSSYLVDVLALKLADELVEALAVGLNTNGLKDLLLYLSVTTLQELKNMLTLMSLAEGEVLPPRPRRRYAARCFILTVVVVDV
jgi:hypothetical protein